MCSRDYKLPIEARQSDKTLEAVVLRAGLFSSRIYDLQGMRKEAADTMEHVFLCATRVALSTDASLDFIEVKMADVLTGATITLWRYVPDIRDSMYQRIGDTEYFNRLVIEIDPGKPAAASDATSDSSSPLSHPKGHSSGPSDLLWDKPLTMSEFLAKQIISRARREGAETIQAHADLSDPATLAVVIENWPSIEEEGPDHVAKVTDSVHKSAQEVLKGYRFRGFQEMTLRDAQGTALGSWTL